MAPTVTKSAVNCTGDAHTQSIVDYFDDMILQNGTNGWVSVPQEYKFSEVQGKKYGEMAEKMVFDNLKKATQDISGIKIINLSNVRITGRINSTNHDNVIREVDSAIFMEYQGLYFFKILETKCNYWIDKATTQTRKKAVGQLKNLKSILASEMHINTDMIQTHIMWPNMQHEESCKCGKLHPTFTKLRDNPEPPNFHIFKDKFVGDKFSSWLKSQVADASAAIDKAMYEKLLAHFCLLSVGALHDREMDCFCVLAPEQRALVAMKENTLHRPLGIRGLAGSGKTVVVCSRIERHYKSGELSETKKAAYVFFNANVKILVENKLHSCGVDMGHVKFIDYNVNECNIQNIFDDETILEELIKNQNISYLYFDSAEDMGFQKLKAFIQKMLASKSSSQKLELQPMEQGDFWILFDDYQGIKDNHSMEKRYGDQLYWVGQKLDEKMLQEGVKQGRICFLTTSFRMPNKILSHIKESSIIPITNFPLSSPVEGIQVTRPPPIDIPSNNKYMETLAREILAHKIFQLTHGQGIHAGYCAILFDDDNHDVIFPPSEGGIDACLQMLNEELVSKFAPTQAKYAPQVTTCMQESIHHKHQELTTSHQEIQLEIIAKNASEDVRATVQHKHDNHPQNLLECECKVYVGSVTEMKGNEARVIIYLQPINRSMQERGELKSKTVNASTIKQNLNQFRNPYLTHVIEKADVICTRKKFCLLVVITAIIASLFGLISSYSFGPDNNYPRGSNESISKSNSLTIFPEETMPTTTMSTLNSSSLKNISTPSAEQVHAKLNYEFVTIFAASIFFMFVILLVVLIYFAKRILKKKQVLRTLPYYLAVSRSCCEAHIIDIIHNISTKEQRTEGTPVGIKKITWIRHQNHMRKRKIRIGLLLVAITLLLSISLFCATNFMEQSQNSELWNCFEDGSGKLKCRSPHNTSSSIQCHVLASHQTCQILKKDERCTLLRKDQTCHLLVNSNERCLVLEPNEECITYTPVHTGARRKRETLKILPKISSSVISPSNVSSAAFTLSQNLTYTCNKNTRTDQHLTCRSPQNQNSTFPCHVLAYDERCQILEKDQRCQLLLGDERCRILWSDQTCYVLKPEENCAIQEKKEYADSIFGPSKS